MADFEAIAQMFQKCDWNDDKSYTDIYKKHINCDYCYKVVCCFDGRNSKSGQVYWGKRAASSFIEKMVEEANIVKG